jgi:flagellin-like protein
MKLIKRRAVSPIIATMLLIAVTILAGVAVVSTVYLVMTAEDPLSITISKPEYYASTESEKAFFDPLVDNILVPITNNNREPLFYNLDEVEVYNATSDEPLDRWSVSNANRVIVAQGQETIYLEFDTEGRFDQDELTNSDEIYFKIPVKKENQQNYEIFTSPNFKVTTAETEPLFQIVPINNAYQQGSNIYFTGPNPDNQNISRDLTFGIFNYGNAQAEKTFSVTLLIENETLITKNETFKILTVPTSISTNNDTVCDVGESCIVSAFNLTKWAVNRAKNNYNAYLSVGTQTIKFNLAIVLDIPDYYVTMPNRRGKNNNQWGEILQFNSKKYWEEETLKLIVTIWNDEDPSSLLGATLEIQDLNTTAFRLDSSNRVTKTIPTGQSLSSIPDESDRCGKGKTKNAACTDFSWTITRKIIAEKGKGKDLGTIYYYTMQPYYTFKVLWIETGLEYAFRIQVAPPKK